MRLSTELEGEFLKLADDQKSTTRVDTVAEADGIMFLCPKCVSTHGWDSHSVICWFRGRVPDDMLPGPERWNPAGTDLNDLTFAPPGAVSVHLTTGCKWHGFVKDGDAA